VPRVLSTASPFDPVYLVESSRASAAGGNQSRSTTAALEAASKSTATGDVQTAAASSSLSSLLAVTEGAFCEAKFVRKVEWPRTAAGKTVVMQCPNNKNSSCCSFVYVKFLIVFLFIFIGRQRSCKPCTSYDRDVCLSVRLSVRHTLALCENDAS